MDTKNDQIAHRRIVAGREILRKYGRSNNSPATGTGPCCQLREKRIKSSISCTCRLARKYESQLGLAQSAAYRIGYLSYVSHSKASEPLPIASSTTGFATSSPFSLFANITT